MEVGNIVSLYLAIYWESVTDILYSHIKIICHWTMGWTIRAPCPDLSSPQSDTKFPIFKSDVGQNICLHFKLQTAPQIDLIIYFRQRVSQSRIVLVTIEKLCYYY